MRARRPGLALLAAGLATALGGCASMSPEQCRSADWRAVGYRDGANGVDRARVDAYAEDCAQVGVHPDRGAYRAGWNAGIPAFCTAERGWRLGLDGYESRYVCVGQPGERAFFRAQEAGLRLYGLRRALRDVEAEVDRLEARLHDEQDAERRSRWRARLREARRDRDYLRDRLLEESLIPAGRY